VRADLRETALGSRAEAIEHRASDRELENAVAEELEALVRLGAILGPRRMREDLLEPVGRQLCDQASELVEPGAVTDDLSPGER